MNDTLLNLIIAFSAVIIAPILGLILTGLGRTVKNIIEKGSLSGFFQEINDLSRLLKKKSFSANKMQGAFVVNTFVFSCLSVIILAMQENLLLLIFSLFFTDVVLLAGASSVNSYFSRMAAQRGISRIFAYMPLLLLSTSAIYLKTGVMSIKGILEYGMATGGLVFQLPFLVITVLVVVMVKLNIAFFDFSTGERRILELNAGLYTEFSGWQLAMLKLAKLNETIVFITLIAIMLMGSIWYGIIASVLIYFVFIVLDCIYANFTWKNAVYVSWIIGGSSVFITLIWIYLKI